ncbi:MAG: hypothetical protein KC635_01125 [Myxococcales bacterium]|nr:hypothetical protein [Myxococcales bacterium]MCB9735106.1 hypothetical protein [Deltaproteobacteria bacterium]
MTGRLRLLHALCLPLAALALVGARAGAASAAAPGVTFSFPASVDSLNDDERSELAFLREKGCRALALTPTERVAVVRAADLVRAALGDPRVARFLETKPDWAIETDERWAPAGGIGAHVLTAWLGAHAPRVSVLAYDRSPGHPCDGGLGDGSVHALNRAGSGVILFNRAYLERYAHAPDPEVGARGLARTLAHEVAHVLGYTHPVGRELVGLKTYNNTVPAILGCVAMNYPNIGYIESECGLPSYAQHASAYEWTCDASAELAGIRPGAVVDVRFGGRWLDAFVRGVDAENARVEIDYGIAEVEPTWIDPCRIRRHGAAATAAR